MENEPLSLPLGATGATLSGQAYSNSSQSMTATSNEGLVYGDGPAPPGIAEELLGDIPLHLAALPIIPEGLGVAAGPPADDPDAADDWASGSYGRMSVSNVGTTASGFSLGGGYSLDAGGGSPAQATRSLASHQSSGYEFTLSSRKDGQTGQWRNTAGSRAKRPAPGTTAVSFIVSGGWGSTTPGLAISGTFVDSQSESSSGSSTASGQLDPASDTWSDHATSRFDQDVATVRTSNGSGDYWHDRYGFDVSGTITVANEHRYTSHHSTSHVYADGSLTPESTGSRYTELITHSLLNSSGGGFDDRTLVSSGPILNHLGDAIGSTTSTTTLDHSANEGHLRDFHTSDRSDWRFDLATGTLVPTQRVQVDSHVIDVSLDLVHDTTVQTQRAGSYTLDQRNHEFEGESESRTREAISSGQNSTRTVTRTTPHEGPGAGVTILVVSGTDDVSHHDFAWLQSHSGVSTSEIHGSDGYYRYQTDTDDTLRTTFDSVHSVQRIDGSGDTRYQGNRGLAGDGWNSDWYEETPSGGGIEVSQGSYHLALTHDDERPNAYDVTVASGSAASVELPGPYRLPTNPQANTPPSGALGPGGFSPPADPSEVAGLRDQVAAAGSSAAAANAAHNANFLVLAQSPGNPETPGTPASENSLQGSATMAGYVQSQIGTPDSANPAAIAAGAADETMVAESDRSLIAVGNIPHFLRGMALGFGDGAIGFVDGAVTAVRGVGQYAHFVWVHWTDGADAAAGTSAGQAIDSAAVLTLKYGPEVARIIQEIHAGQLSPETWGLIAQVQPLVDEILDAIAEEFDSLSVEEQAELIGRITTATIVEVVAFVGTAGAGTALSVAAKTGKLANITSKLGGYSSKLTNKVSAAIGKFVNKVDKVAPKGGLGRIFSSFDEFKAGRNFADGDEASKAWDVYQRAAGSRGLTIGKTSEILEHAGQNGRDVLYFVRDPKAPFSGWTWEINKAWLDGAIDSRLTIQILTPAGELPKSGALGASSTISFPKGTV